MSRSDKEWAADNSVLSRFARSGRWEFLERLLPSVWTTGFIIAEVEEGLKNPKYAGLKVVLEAVRKGWLKVIENEDLTEEERATMAKVPMSLGDADASLIAVCVHRGMGLLTVDERLSEEAKQRRIEVKGIWELLSDAIVQGLLTPQEADEILDDMESRASYRLLRRFAR
ncbi:MAG: PIN domain-containing protein [Armatimonadota bacterium]